MDASGLIGRWCEIPSAPDDGGPPAEIVAVYYRPPVILRSPSPGDVEGRIAPGALVLVCRRQDGQVVERGIAVVSLCASPASARPPIPDPGGGA